jgi:outer membrane immunogenic protein
MRINYGQEVLIGGGVTSSQDITDTRVGYTVGAGVEWGITEQLSLKAEYDFLDFGTKSYDFNALGAPLAGTFPVSIRSMLHVFTVGFNYRFNWGGGGAVAARY